MTNESPSPIDWDAVMQKYATWEGAAAGLVPENKARLFAFLASAPITHVIVTFDGEGDSGQIEDVQFHNGDEQGAPPSGKVEILELPYGSTEPRQRNLPLAEALETLAYDLLQAEYAGWENSDGAYGEFTFDVTAGTITLDYNGRFMSSEFHQHSW